GLARIANERGRRIDDAGDRRGVALRRTLRHVHDQTPVGLFAEHADADRAAVGRPRRSDFIAEAALAVDLKPVDAAVARIDTAAHFARYLHSAGKAIVGTDRT